MPIRPEVAAIGRQIVRILIGQSNLRPCAALPRAARAIARQRKAGLSEQDLRRLPDCIAFADNEAREVGQALAQWLLEYSKRL